MRDVRRSAYGPEYWRGLCSPHRTEMNHSETMASMAQLQPTLQRVVTPAIGVVRALGVTIALLGLTWVAACGQEDEASSCVDACGTPPPPTCVGDESHRYIPFGECVDGVCVYERAAPQTCDQGCRDGVCVGEAPMPDDCDIDVCGPTPAPRCEGSTAITFEEPTCEDVAAGCAFPESRTACGERGEGCRAGRCVALTCDAPCDAPPEGACDGDVAIRFSSNGDCFGGECRYASETEDCAADGRFCRTGGRCVSAQPCGGEPCNSPPPVCRGEQAISFVDGRCERASDTCIFGEDITRCGDLPSHRCADGVCVYDPCRDVVCDLPPEPLCDGHHAIGYEAAGTCINGDCEYAEIREDCEASGRFCFEGNCVATDVCEAVDCSEPPAARCDGGVMVVVEEPGACEGGTCIYDEVRTNCSASLQFCSGGACVDDDPCDGVTCQSPPSDRCDGPVARRFSVPGVCSGAVCSYPPDSVDCSATGGHCFQGACIATDPCAGVSCDSPGSPTCDGPFAVTPVAPGTCAFGACTYPENRVNCEAGGGVCDDGVCDYGALCEDVVCDAPPVSDCHGDTAITYPEGVCVAGTCTYPPVEIDCAPLDAYCSAGACLPIDRCIGLTCTIPPPPRCDANIAITWEVPGTCTDGLCAYDPVEDDCAARGSFCFDGACQADDPCALVTCLSAPHDRCEGDTLRRFSNPGSCVAGICSYPPDDTDCAAIGGICHGVACVGMELCEGVTCDAPPGDICIAGAVIGFEPIGQCRAGTCTYTSFVDDCASRDEFCVSGTCTSVDPCAGDVCVNPPESRCEANVAVRYPEIGACIEGGCTYTENRVDCDGTGQLCEFGQCITPDACGDIRCDTPPSGFCFGHRAISFALPGGCLSGSCIYNESNIDCAALGLACRSGVCVDLCADEPCGDPPAPRCGPESTIIFAGDPACDSATGACEWSEIVEVCEGDTYCDGTRCVDPCEGVVCDDPPEPNCEGELLVSQVSPGICRNAECFYPEFVEFDCNSIDQRCVQSTCTDEDPCDIIECAILDTQFCDGETLVVIDGPALCDNDVGCIYDDVREETDCRALGLTCFDEACTEPPSPMRDTIRITEYRTGPSGVAWFEIANLMGVRMSLADIALSTTTYPSSHAFELDDEIAPLEVIVVSASAEVGAYPTDVVWPDLELHDHADAIWIQLRGEIIGVHQYDTAAGWPSASAQPAQLDNAGGTVGVHFPDVWCPSPSHGGSPGDSNPLCYSCDEPEDCPSLGDRCLDDGHALFFVGGPACFEGACILAPNVGISDCHESALVCRDGACEAP